MKLQIVDDPNGPGWLVRTGTGGMTSQVLAIIYTSYQDAQYFVDAIQSRYDDS